MASVSLRLPDEVTQRLETLAALTGRSKTFYMVEAIREHIDDLEDLYLAERDSHPCLWQVANRTT